MLNVKFIALWFIKKKYDSEQKPLCISASWPVFYKKNHRMIKYEKESEQDSIYSHFNKNVYWNDALLPLATV